MQFVHSQNEHIKEFNLFTLTPTRNAVERMQWIEYRPLARHSEGAPIDIIIPGKGSDYIDLKRSWMHVKFKVVKVDGTNVGVDDKLSTINNTLHSLFSQVDVFFNGILVSASTINYHYKAYLDILLNNDKNAKETHLMTHGFIKDTAGYMNATDVMEGGNSGMADRHSLIAGSKIAHLHGALMCDVTQLDKWVVNGVDVHLRLWPSKPDFVLVKDAAIVGNFKITVDDIFYRVCKVTPKPEILMAQSNALSKSPALYNYDRSRIQTYGIASGSYLFREDNVFQYEKPTRVVLGFVTSQSFSGSLTQNPYDFQNLDVSQVALYVDDLSLPAQPMKLNFPNKDYLEAYYSMISGLGLDIQDRGNDITIDEYDSGYCFFVFDLRGGLGNGTLSTLEKRNIRIEVNFRTPLPNPITALVYGTFADVFQIDKARNVLPRKL